MEGTNSYDYCVICKKPIYTLPEKILGMHKGCFRIAMNEEDKKASKK